MIQYSRGIHGYEIYNDTNIKKQYQNLLEKTLRYLGNFKDNEPIIITSYSYGEEYSDLIYEVKDLDNTVFNFYNFTLGHIGDNRFEKNYHIIMKKEKSNIFYKYDFYNAKYKQYEQKLRTIELSYFLTEEKVIRLERKVHQSIRIIVEEKNKKYILGFYDNREEHDKKLLEEFEKIIERYIEITDLNLESLLKLLPNLKKLSYAYIYIDNKKEAMIEFINGNISRYEYNSEIEKIPSTPIVKFDIQKEKIVRCIPKEEVQVSVSVGDKIIRNVKKIYNGQSSEKKFITENYESIQSECKMLLKHL